MSPARYFQGGGGGRYRSWSCITELDGQNRVIVIAESLARIVAAIRITSVGWRSHLPPNTEIGLHRPCVLHCDSNRAIGLFSSKIPSMWKIGVRELTALAERKRMAIGDFSHLRSQIGFSNKQECSS